MTTNHGSMIFFLLTTMGNYDLLTLLITLSPLRSPIPRLSFHRRRQLGLENISACNGWSMAFAGATIVLCGLAVLSFLVSLIPKIMARTEKKEPAKTDVTAESEKEKPVDHLTADLKTVADLYAPLIKELPSSFDLKQLFEITNKKGFPHPHLTIKRLRNEGVLVSEGKGMFTWKG